MLYLNVPDEQVNMVEELGAKWDLNKEKWYVSEPDRYFRFNRWFNIKSANIICETLYLLETKTYCWYCGNLTRIVCLASDKFYTTFYNNPCSCNTRLTLFFFLINCPDYLKKLLKTYNYDYRFSKRFDIVYKHFNNGYYICNKCNTCHYIQGDYFLHQLNRPRCGFYKCIGFSSRDSDLKMHKLINLPSAVELIADMHEDDIWLHMQTGIENLASIDTDKYILEQAFKDEIDITKYLK